MSLIDQETLPLDAISMKLILLYAQFVKDHGATKYRRHLLTHVKN